MYNLRLFMHNRFVIIKLVMWQPVPIYVPQRRKHFLLPECIKHTTCRRSLFKRARGLEMLVEIIHFPLTLH